MTSRAKAIADHERRAHHHQLVIRTGHLVLLRADWKRPGEHEMVRRDMVARDDRHQRDSTGSRRGKVMARAGVKRPTVSPWETVTRPRPRGPRRHRSRRPDECVLGARGAAMPR